MMGKSIIDGIIKGLKDAAGALWTWLTGILGGMVQGVKDFFGITSPSKLMAEEVGKPLAWGIGVGFAQAFKDVQRDIIRSTGSIAGMSFAGVRVPISTVPGLPGGGGLSSAGGSISSIGGTLSGRGGGNTSITFPHLTIHAGAGVNGAQIAEEFIAEVSARIEQRRGLRNAYST